MAKKVSFLIDKKRVVAAEGANLLQAARDAGFNIPGLCYHPRLSVAGACRLCAVKVEGERNLVLACSTEVSEGLRVTAFDEELETRRRVLIDLLLADHDCNCLNCDRAGECEIQELGYRYGLIGLDGKRFKQTYKDAGAKFARFPSGRAKKKDTPSHVHKEGVYKGVPADCIRCGACIEACPMHLYPVLMMEAEQLADRQMLASLHPKDCINCELCSYVCPAEIRLVKHIRKAHALDEKLNIPK